MKVIARMELKPGMVVAEDILNYKNEIILTANTRINDTMIEKLARQSIMVVPIKEEIDFATTHFEKVRLSEGFKSFESTYNIYFPVYKNLMMSAVTNRTPIKMEQLMEVYRNIIVCAKSGELLLDYLYNMLPGEDDMTHAHCLNSALIAGVFGTWLGLSNEDINLLIQCAFVYDIGKLSIPYQILWKPERLTSEEYRLVMRHTTIGHDFLAGYGTFDQHVLNAALQHHERCDGSGYPKALTDTEIDRFAKYIAIIDTYEAMTSPRSYRQKLNPFQIIANYENEGFVRYDFAAIKSILSHIAGSQLGFNVQLNSGQIGEVILINEKSLSRPLIKLNTDNTLIDMSANPQLAIVSVF
ncbi:HD-GYP domain-containing protein [Butyrivibrio sp. FCS014]|uniref:HD-GYP domain-containing protein n=1 Tax=Butyrivibrio sp. FCS014 TaxID=1408304 RepID=UPI0004635E7C|nr:HD domain-containing phosphohydrolase [Butyrivibrio sp. FCS014]